MREDLTGAARKRRTYEAAASPPRQPARPLAKGQAGGVLLMFVIASVALFGVAALATDVGHVWAARTELQAVVDAAALASAANLVNVTTTSVTLPAATANAQTYGLANQADQKAITILASDLTFGDWDLQLAQLNTAVDLSDPDQVTGVRVLARLDQTANGPVQTVLARVVGRQSFAFAASATGYLGFAGSFPPGTVDLPIGIDCCAISGPACENDYCSTVQSSPPNPCLLADGVTQVTCLEFDPTPGQNACWTEFDELSPSINTPGLEEIVRGGNASTEGISSPVYLDNGDKTPVVRTISEKFHGTGEFSGNPSGTDRYAPFDGVSDSWVVGLPVFECQTDTHCAGGDPQRIVGAVCLEIREVIVTPDKVIKARFLCSGDSLFSECGIGGPGSGSGGKNFGVRANVPVLVQ